MMSCAMWKIWEKQSSAYCSQLPSDDNFAKQLKDCQEHIQEHALYYKKLVMLLDRAQMIPEELHWDSWDEP